MTTIELDVEQAVQELTEGLEGKEQAIRRAVSRADRKFSAWAERQIRMIASRASEIPQKILKDNRRIFVRKERTPEGMVTNIWIGLNPIYADELGRPVKTDVGVKIGRFGEFHQAFIINNKVFYRVGRERFPIARAVYAFNDPVVQAIERMELPAQKRFMELLEQELNYAINHE